MPHAGDVKRITQIARSINPQVYIIIRVRFVNDMKALYETGADEFIPEEFETSSEIFSRLNVRKKQYCLPNKV